MKALKKRRRRNHGQESCLFSFAYSFSSIILELPQFTYIYLHYIQEIYPQTKKKKYKPNQSTEAHWENGPMAQS